MSMSIPECQIVQAPLHLRSLIEAWQRDGLIRPEVAERALTPRTGRSDPSVQSPMRTRRPAPFAYFGVIFVVAAVGLPMADSEVGLVTALLIAITSLWAITAAASRRA
jgi:hypothetical protein